MQGYYTDLLPRGIRNRNPGNVRATPHTKWIGQTGIDADGFLQFVSPQMGIRCMAKIIRNYLAKDGLHTVGEVITRWAPPPENPTSDYITHVVREMDCSASTRLDPANLPVSLVEAMISFENGYCPYAPAVIQRGIHMVYVNIGDSKYE